MNLTVLNMYRRNFVRSLVFLYNTYGITNIYASIFYGKVCHESHGCFMHTHTHVSFTEFWKMTFPKCINCNIIQIELSTGKWIHGRKGQNRIQLNGEAEGEGGKGSGTRMKIKYRIKEKRPLV